MLLYALENASMEILVHFLSSQEVHGKAEVSVADLVQATRLFCVEGPAQASVDSVAAPQPGRVRTRSTAFPNNP